MTEQPARPVALMVLPDNIPVELKELPIWSCWRYEWNGKRWTKVPYTPFTTSKASSTRSSSWRSFQAAHACYQERRDFFDGLFIALRDEDPYTGGDFDHSTDLARVPVTYAELSPSGHGIRFIGIGSVPTACTKSTGELYYRARFLSITGHRLDGFPTDIRPIQPELDALYEELKPAPREAREGIPGNGSRAAQVAAIPDDVWEAGRQERRTNINRNLARLRASAVSRKTQKDDTQLGYLLREDYRGFHEKWPNAGIVKGDGSIDRSQIRAIMASSIKMRRFTFPEFAALMSYFFGTECVEKWGTKQGVQEEFAALWFKGRSPRDDESTPPPAPAPIKRGRGSDHAALLDRAYLALLDYRAGTDALVTVQELAGAIGIHRRTAITLLQELRTAGRIDYKQFRQHAGIIVSFSGVINEENASGDSPHNERLNGHNPDRPISAEGENAPHMSGVINRNDESGIDSAENDASDETISADEETRRTVSGVINEPIDSAPAAAPESGEAALITPDDERGSEAPLYIYITSTVYLPGLITPEKRVSIADAVTDAFDALPRDRVSPSGELKRWLVTDQRIVAYVAEHYADQDWKAEAVRFWIGKIRKRRKAAAFDELRGLRRDALEKKAASARRQIARAEEKAVTAEMPELRDWYAKRAAQLSGQSGLLAWEMGRRDALDATRIERDGYSQGEQAEMLDLVAQATEARPMARRALQAQPPPGADVGSLVARLKARKVND